MDFLKKELERKKKLAKEEFGGKKFVTRAEIERKRLERLKGEEQMEQEKKKMASLKATSDGSSHRIGSPTSAGSATSEKLPVAGSGLRSGTATGASGLPSANSSADDAEKLFGNINLTKTEILKRLRSLGQPITLFGEDDADRLDRLKNILRTTGENSAEVELRGEGQQNDFLRDIRGFDKGASVQSDRKRKKGRDSVLSVSEASEKEEKRRREGERVEEGSARPGRGEEGGEGEKAAGGKGEAGGDGEGEGRKEGEEREGFGGQSGFEDLREKLLGVGQREVENERKGGTAREGAGGGIVSKEDMILIVFDYLLREWGEEVERMAEAERRTAKGKQAIATFKQCARYIEPLFKLCKKKRLELDILDSLHQMCCLCLQREYLVAMDKYIRLAIGNAPWPIGVTMVGIHERSAREKIHTNSVAHVMNDETTRKFLQSVKRLMTFCQRKHPAAPSRSVEFNSLANGSDLQALLVEEERLKERAGDALRLTAEGGGGVGNVGSGAAEQEQSRLGVSEGDSEGSDSD